MRLSAASALSARGVVRVSGYWRGCQGVGGCQGVCIGGCRLGFLRLCKKAEGCLNVLERVLSVARLQLALFYVELRF